METITVNGFDFDFSGTYGDLEMYSHGFGDMLLWHDLEDDGWGWGATRRDREKSVEYPRADTPEGALDNMGKEPVVTCYDDGRIVYAAKSEDKESESEDEESSYSQSPRLPEEIPELEDKGVCPLCGDIGFDGTFCNVCGYEAPPEGLGDIKVDHKDESEDKESEKTAAQELMYDISDDPSFYLDICDRNGGDYRMLDFTTITTSDDGLQELLDSEGAEEL